MGFEKTIPMDRPCSSGLKDVKYDIKYHKLGVIIKVFQK